MRVACVLKTYLRAMIEAKRRLGLKDRPVVTVDRSPASRTVVPGMTLDEAAAL